jgi:hypothetical protein
MTAPTAGPEPTLTDTCREYEGITYVIPCSGAKLDHPAPARNLYTGQHFHHALINIERLAALDETEGRGPARVLILSARHGLVDPDTVLAPYDQRMDSPGAITAAQLTDQARTLGIDWGAEVYTALPKPYLARLDQALRELDVYVQDIYEGTASIGEQRRVLSIIGRPPALPAVPDGPGPTIWLGGDVNAFAWGVPLMVSYGRLRHARTLPIATAPWVIDSRGFNEIAEHGRWTIDPAQYVTDLRRYRDEIGHLVWAAPQDWPAAAPMLQRTGLTEQDHQERTTASVLELRALAPDLPIVTVVTGTTAAGYLRHCRIYADAGIDLHAEQRPPAQRRLRRLVPPGPPPGRPMPARPDPLGTQLPARRPAMGRPTAAPRRNRTSPANAPAVRPRRHRLTRPPRGVHHPPTPPIA